ncbi:hypothetical protein [Metabacillus niabensis]|uniref:Uncharacterized protein n=1 Tax=Metabacillus niabensis TaxID=324854 RepID=A0ABT9Z1D5_9BACI|nr:hypothetical protein [Metabacillus niabensis]MDQ0226060.1 hypothetical protein [Metabacillus niabensis]
MTFQMTDEVIERVFFKDGSLRDIYVQACNLNDWQKFYDWIRTSSWNILLYKDDQLVEYKGKFVDYLFKEKKNHHIRLTIPINGILINCYFFSEDEIEFDIDPKEINNVYDANTVFEFMKSLAKILGKQCILSEENTPEIPLVTFYSDGSMISKL